MDFSLNDDQKLLRDSVQKFIQGDYDFETRRKLVKSEKGWSAQNWAQFAELGWLAMPFAEEDGGLGWSPVETMILLEEFGKGLVVEPFIETVVAGGGFLRRASAELRSQYLEQLIGGELQAAFAAAEYERTFSLTEVETSLADQGSHFVLNGKKCLVLNGDQADVLIVLARSAGQPGDATGLSLVVVDANAEGVSRTGYRTVDGHRAADVTFSNVVVGKDRLIGEAGNALPIAQAVVNEIILALAAEAVGAMNVLLYTTVEYCKTRKQFGIAIGNFQALQHRMANMFIALEQTRSLLLMATLKVHEVHDDAQQGVYALKAQIGKAGRLLGQEAVQLHGGMGMTDELHIGHYFKRVTAIDALFGNADQHVTAYAVA